MSSFLRCPKYCMAIWPIYLQGKLRKLSHVPVCKPQPHLTAQFSVLPGMENVWLQDSNVGLKNVLIELLLSESLHLQKFHSSWLEEACLDLYPKDWLEENRDSWVTNPGSYFLFLLYPVIRLIFYYSLTSLSLTMSLLD